MSHSDDVTPAAPSLDTILIGVTDHEPLDVPSDQITNTTASIRSLSASVNGLRSLLDDVQSRVEALEAEVVSLLATHSVVERSEQRTDQQGRNHTPVEEDGGINLESAQHEVPDPRAREASSPYPPSPSPSLMCSMAEETPSAHATQQWSSPLMPPLSSPEPSQPWLQLNRSSSSLELEEPQEPQQPAAVFVARRTSRPEWIVDMVRFHGENCSEGSDFSSCDLCRGWQRGFEQAEWDEHTRRR